MRPSPAIFAFAIVGESRGQCAANPVALYESRLIGPRLMGREVLHSPSTVS